ncbi:MAG: F0F1 ATP synthase subunit C [Alphaproteobacteria bacterium]|nr:MAG: F0F1 ATP synthase subunit C [Alphaproteobacteria bacterium]
MEMESLKFIGAGIAAFGMLGAALGVGMIFAALMNGIARNPAAEPKMRGLAIFGAVFAELMGILSFVIGILMAT